MHPLNTRYFRLHDSEAKEPDRLRERINDLCHVVQGMAQDLHALRGMLERRGLWDESEYRQQRIDRMIADHSAAGQSPWTNYSIYPYTRDEDDFLISELAADETELKEFRRRAKFVSELS